jgi:hypothetical protein
MCCLGLGLGLGLCPLPDGPYHISNRPITRVGLIGPMPFKLFRSLYFKWVFFINILTQIFFSKGQCGFQVIRGHKRRSLLNSFSKSSCHNHDVTPICIAFKERAEIIGKSFCQ